METISQSGQSAYKVAVYGGAFDPPTIAHREIASCLLKSFDEVWLFPCYCHKFGKNMTDPNIRLQMCHEMASELSPQVKIRNDEIVQKFQGNTYQFLNNLQNLNPTIEFTLILGGDNLENIHKWENYEELISEFKFLAFIRNGYKSNKKFDNLKISYWPIPNVSSTQFRNSLNKNIVPEAVWAYIQEKGLYQ